MRHQQQLLRGVERDHRGDRPTAGEQAAQPVAGEHPLDEVLAQPGVTEAPFLLDRQVG